MFCGMLSVGDRNGCMYLEVGEAYYIYSISLVSYRINYLIFLLPFFLVRSFLILVL